MAHTGFLSPENTAALVLRLRQAGTSVHVSGGFPGARRRVVTAFPERIPEATTPLTAYYVAEADDEAELRAALRQQVNEDELGDVVKHAEGLSVVILERTQMPETVRLSGRLVGFEKIALERLASSSIKRQLVIVPSLRVDALGAKAFGVSRSYFAKGVKVGNVSVNGSRAGKSSSAEAGDEVYAEGLGRFSVVSVAGETRRGNLKVNLEIEKS